jgi:hypothetical protein
METNKAKSVDAFTKAMKWGRQTLENFNSEHKTN